MWNLFDALALFYTVGGGCPAFPPMQSSAVVRPVSISSEKPDFASQRPGFFRVRPIHWRFVMLSKRKSSGNPKRTEHGEADLGQKEAELEKTRADWSR